MGGNHDLLLLSGRNWDANMYACMKPWIGKTKMFSPLKKQSNLCAEEMDTKNRMFSPMKKQSIIHALETV